MLEGYQHGRHLQMTFSVLRENAKSYVEISDKVEVQRLKAMLRTFRDKGRRFCSLPSLPLFVPTAISPLKAKAHSHTSLEPHG